MIGNEQWLDNGARMREIEQIKKALDNPAEADRKRRRETAWLILALLSLLGIWIITS